MVNFKTVAVLSTVFILQVFGCNDDKWEKMGQEYNECVRDWHFGLMKNDGWSDEFCRQVSKVKDCQKIILQCNDIRPGEAENIISQARTISSMTKRCDERKPVDKEVKGQKAKRSATSEEGQKDNGSAGRRKRQFNWGMISKVVEKVIPQVAKSGSDFLGSGSNRDLVSQIVKAAAENPEAAKEIASEIAKTVPELAKNKELVSEVIKTGTEIAKNPGAAVDVVKTGVELVKKGAEILPDPRDFRDLAELVQAASSAVGLFNAGSEEGMDQKCLKYDPFFNWYTCTCSFEECLRLEYGGKKHSAATTQRAATAVVLMLGLLSTAWAVIAVRYLI